MNVRMKRAYTYDVDGGKGVKRTLPAGWVGEVDDKIGEAAIEAGAAFNTEEGRDASGKAEKPAPKPKA